MGLLQSILAASGNQSRLQQAARGQSQASPAQDANGTDQAANSDSLTLRNQNPQVNYNKRININQYKSSVGNDRTFVRETLRHKIAEYGLKPATRLTVTKAETGGVTLSGHVPAATLQQINGDLNQNRNFIDAVNRLSVNQPTLDYVDNVVKVSRAYGANNALFDSLIGEKDSGNLGEIAQRYRDLQQTRQPATNNSGIAAANGNGFRLTINENA